MKRALVTVLLLCAAGCGGDDPNPFTLMINSRDVVQLAVRQVTVVFEPAGLDQDFAMAQSMAWDDATVLAETVITPGGRRGYRITLEEPYVDANFLDQGTTFKLPVFLSTNDDDDPSIENPRVLVTFVRNGEEIGVGERFVTWPLVPGATEEVNVSCLMTTRLQCTNNDP
jgi:hypothetical protein